MDIDNGNNGNDKVNEWLGWVCAYVAFNGLAFNAYVGKPISREGMLITLGEAFEYSSITQYGQGGQIARAFIGAPIEFSTIKEITVQALAVIELGLRSEEELAPFIGARKEVRNKLLNARKGSSLVTPATALPSNILNIRR